MRDKRFIAEHRGGCLTKKQHQELVLWAYRCVGKVLPLFETSLDKRLIHAIKTAEDWVKDNATVSDARNASLNAIALANELTDPIERAIARSAGHAVATAHMADHAIIASEYALKAIKLAGKSIDIEEKWQEKQLTEGIFDLVTSAKLKKNTKTKPA